MPSVGQKHIHHGYGVVGKPGCVECPCGAKGTITNHGVIWQPRPRKAAK